MWELAEALTARGTGAALTLRDNLLERVVETEATALALDHLRPRPTEPIEPTEPTSRPNPGPSRSVQDG